MKLTSKEKAKVRKYAQQIKATFQIGAKELHEKNIMAIKEGFNNKEVLKIKINREDKNDKNITKEIASLLEEKVNVQVAGIIGTTIILYKENANLEEHIV